MILVQFVVSIIYLGSWFTFIFVRVPRLVWGCVMAHWKLKIFRSTRALLMMKADYILRLATLVIYVGLSFGFSVWLPEQFCELIGRSEDSFSSCKWQVFGFRFVFILLYLPVELLTLAVVYRNATDMIFKIQLRKATGGTDDLEMESAEKRSQSSSIAYLMSPEIAL